MRPRSRCESQCDRASHVFGRQRLTRNCRGRSFTDAATPSDTDVDTIQLKRIDDAQSRVTQANAALGQNIVFSMGEGTLLF